MELDIVYLNITTTKLHKPYLICKGLVKLCATNMDIFRPIYNKNSIFTRLSNSNPIQVTIVIKQFKPKWKIPKFYLEPKNPVHPVDKGPTFQFLNKANQHSISSLVISLDTTTSRKQKTDCWSLQGTFERWTSLIPIAHG
jgi:hypothetical protein